MPRLSLGKIYELNRGIVFRIFETQINMLLYLQMGEIFYSIPTIKSFIILGVTQHIRT